MKKSKMTPWYRRVKCWHILLYVILLLVVVMTSMVEYRARYRDTLRLFQNQAQTTATAIAYSGTQQARLTENLQESYLARAIDLLHTIDELDREGLLTPLRLERLQQSGIIFEITLLDGAGQVRNPVSEGRALGRGPGFKRLIQPLISGAVDTLIAGLPTGGPHWRHGENNAGARFIVGIRRSRGGAIISHLTVAAETDFRANINLERLLQEMLDIEGIAYINFELPGYQSILVSNLATEFDLYSSPRQLIQEDLYLVNINDEIFIEVINYIIPKGEPGLIRVAFTTQPMADLWRSVFIQIIIRSGLLTLTMVVTILFILSRQNAMLLRSEKERIEAEVQRLEQLNRIQEKQAAIGTLAAGLAHEIRNPLNAIGIIAQRLKREYKSGAEDGEVAKMSTTMASEITRLNKILEDFLNFSRPTPLKIVRLNMSELVSGIHDLFGKQAEEQGLEIIIESGTETDLEGDPEYLKQALANIVKNSLEATPRGGRITISVTGTKEDIIVKIVDTGQGIAAENINRIFDIFYTTKDSGNGIGLAVTHKIISDHAGTIEVFSSPAGGTEFLLNLPRSHK
ncbi:MAG: hypothetical protein H8E14_02445 [Candidatus Marinimicrobia bacterium]|nr:hypothetical protein [Candidatus Neomarinimicrobiota bacterium]